MKTEVVDITSQQQTMFHHSHSLNPHQQQLEHSDSHSPLPLLLPPPQPQPTSSTPTNNRPRGRPPGSKNKPKPPIIITADPPDPPMSPHVLELQPGSDILDSTTRFCRKRGIGFTILNGNGLVSNITLKNQSNVAGSTVTFHGQFELLSLTGTVLPDGFECGSGSGSGFGVSVAGPQGQVVGGLVVGPLVAAGTVYIVGATFNSPQFHRLGSGGGGDVATGGSNGEFCRYDGGEGVVWENNNNINNNGGGGRVQTQQQTQQQQQHY